MTISGSIPLDRFSFVSDDTSLVSCDKRARHVTPARQLARRRDRRPRTGDVVFELSRARAVEEMETD
jgi:hypothetical protein